MALNKATLKESIKAGFVAAKQNTDDPDAAFDALAGAISDAVDIYVKQMTITYTTGLTAPNGPVAGVFGNTIS
jgi:hypothetical protein